MLLALLWFGMAYRQRRVRWWEAALVVAGGVAVLVRAGNAWVYALAMVPPLAVQLIDLRPKGIILAAMASLGIFVAATLLFAGRPPVLPPAALAAARSADRKGDILADWRWAGDLQQQLGDQHVLAAHGLTSESTDFWLDYVRITQDSELWPTELQSRNVNLLVLNTEDRGVVDQVRASGDWQVLYDGSSALVAERRGA
jgi:hypothetical protein